MDIYHRALLSMAMLTTMVDVTFSEKNGGVFPRIKSYIHDGEEISPAMNPLRGVYLKNVDRVWVLQEEMGVWALVFHNLSIEDSPRCRHDFLEIREVYDGVNKSANLDLKVKRYCGSDVPRPFVSKRSHVEVRFITDSLWEMEGFHIKAIHGLNSDILQSKIKKYTGGEPKNLIMDSNDNDRDMTSSNHEGTVFYILIAAAVIALIVFGTLLTYFIITMRKINHRREQEPGLYFISGNQSSQAKNSNQVSRTDHKRNAFNIAVETSGKRYTRGKLTATNSPVCPTPNEHSKDAGTLSHHNYMYVSNFQFSGN